MLAFCSEKSFFSPIFIANFTLFFLPNLVLGGCNSIDKMVYKNHVVNVVKLFFHQMLTQISLNVVVFPADQRIQNRAGVLQEILHDNTLPFIL